MKILTYTSLFPSSRRPLFGVFVFHRVVQLAKEQGNDVAVIAPVPYFPRWIKSDTWGIYSEVPQRERFENLPVEHPRYPLLPGFLMPLHGFLMFLGSLAAARRMHKEHHFECIDAHYVYPDGFAAVLVGKVLGVPTVVSARGTDINLFPSFRLIRPMIRWTLGQAAGLIAVSAALKESMVRLGVPKDKVVVIPNGVDVTRFHRMPRGEARQKLGLACDFRMVVSVASLTEGKNHKLLISAFSKMAESGPPTRLYIIGEGPLRGDLERQVRSLSLENRVLFGGPRPNEELALWFNAADVSCLVSAREGWPNVVTESIACGTPVVASCVGGIPEILVTPDLGVLVELGPDSILEGLQRALSKEWNRDWLVHYAHSRSWTQVATEVEAYLSTQIQRSDQQGQPTT